MNKKQVLYQKIVLKSAEIFQESGFEKTTMNTIARAMQMGKSSLYYYFKGKSDIYKAVIQYEAKEFRAKIVEAVEDEPQVLEKIRVYVFTRLKYFLQFQNLYKALKSEQLSEIGFIKEFRETNYAEEIKYFREIIELGVDENIFTIYDTELAATAIITAIKGMETPIFINKIARDVDSTIRDSISIILYGIVKR